MLKLAEALQEENYLTDSEKFVETCMLNWSELSLNQRISALVRALERILGTDYLKARSCMLRIAPRFCCSYEHIFIPEYIGKHALPYPELAFEDLAEVTRYSTAEFAIRAYIELYEEFSMRKLLEWTKHENEHVRRLASEGCRPALPWGKALRKFKENPAPIFPILEALIHDQSLYVRKSVANNLNDISKQHPDKVIAFARKHMGSSKEADWILKRALRSLLKAGCPAALELFGYGNTDCFEVLSFDIYPKALKTGETIKLLAKIKNKSSSAQKIRLEYRIHYLRQNDKYNKKTFQLAETTLLPGEIRDFNSTRSFREMSTRKHYPGEHYLAFAVNGVDHERLAFMLHA